jgi:pseudaminic acid biosynthesis-associated methylase
MPTTDQERFWAGEFGDAYVDRNVGHDLLSAKTMAWSRILARAQGLGSAVEFGSNIGLNLQAIRRLMPKTRLTGIEINAKAHAELARIPEVQAIHGSFLEVAVPTGIDLAFTFGVLIHLAPEMLPTAYDRLYQASRRYVAIIEYYNQTPVEIPYRGHHGKLYKRDFAGEMLDRFPDLALVDYGFFYRRDPMWPLDDGSWFLLEKRPHV